MECKECGVSTSNPNFCCRSCNASYNNRNNHWRNKPEHKQYPAKCLSCDTQLDKLNKKYCSIQCQANHTTQRKITEWKQGGHVGKGIIKRYLASLRNECWECGISSWNGKELVLELEHIDGNSMNNKEENLSLLCPNCHSQTPTYKGRNVGNGRHWRRERYAKGKSY